VESSWFWDNDALSIFRWHVGFDLIGEIIHTLVLWVKMPFLPFEFWEPSIIKILGDSMGLISKQT